MAPNDVWAMDFKGQFRTGKSYCYPFTISDQYSRYLLGCEGLDGTQGGPAQAVLAAVFREFGLPEVIRSDNGSPFASTGRHGLTRLAVWLIRQGISLERIEPGRPDQNGRHERMHRTLKAETTRPACSNLLAQQERFDDFRKYYNESRPHEALGMRPPAEVYEPSDRSYQEYLEPLTYPLHDITTIVTEDGKAYISPFKKRVYIGGALAGETVGLRELDDGCWIVHFSDIELGLIDINLGGLLVITTNPSQTPAPRR
jgi:hypothetical protein